jgi:hypothetical protein
MYLKVASGYVRVHVETVVPFALWYIGRLQTKLYAA